MANPLIFKTNDHFYNVIYVAKLEKVGDTKLLFTMTNNMKYSEVYNTSDDRDNAYKNFMDNFVVDNDS